MSRQSGLLAAQKAKRAVLLEAAQHVERQMCMDSMQICRAASRHELQRYSRSQQGADVRPGGIRRNTGYEKSGGGLSQGKDG